LVNEILQNKLNLQLSDLQSFRLLNYSNKILDDECKIKNRSNLLDEMAESYYNKSQNYLEYFITNISQSFNKTTNKKYTEIWLNNGVFSFEDDLQYNKDFSLYIEEKNKGKYLKQQDGLLAQKRFAKVKYIEYLNEKRDVKKLFITITLPSKYHKYTQKTNKNPNDSKYNDNNFILNKNYEFNYISFEQNIQNNLKLLNEIYKYFYKQLDKYIKRYVSKKYNVSLKEIEEDEELKELCRVDKIKMLEPHASLTPHLHSLLFISEELEEVFYQVYKITLEKYELNKEFCPIEDIQTAKASSYVAKYILKNLGNSEDEENKTKIDIVNQYMRYFSNVRFFNTSNFIHTTQKEIDIVYSYLKRNNKEFLNELKQRKEPLYWSLEQLIKDEIFKFQYEEKEIKIVDYTKLEKDIKELYTKDIEENEIIKDEINYIEKTIKNINENNIVNYMNNKYYPKNDKYILNNTTLKYKNSNNKEELNYYKIMLNIRYKEVLKYFNQRILELEVKQENIEKEIKKHILFNTDKYIKQATIKIFQSGFVKKFSILNFKKEKQQIEAETGVILNSKEDLGFYEYELIKHCEEFVEHKVELSYFEPFKGVLND